MLDVRCALGYIRLDWGKRAEQRRYRGLAVKKLFLHIGFNKTGSTSIQESLLRNAPRLLERGVFYPCNVEAAYFQRVQHVPLAAALPGMKLGWLNARKAGTVGQAYDDLFGAIEQSQFETLILSSEGFGATSITAKQLDWLKRCFEGYRITIIAYIRPQDAYLLSAYQQRVKAGGKGGFQFGMHESMESLRFGSRLAPWREAFGPENVIVRPFAPKLWHEGELFFDFLNALEIPRDGLDIAEPANEGLDYRAVELLRALNALQKRGAGRRKLYLNLAFNFDKLAGGTIKKTKMALSSEQSNLLREYYRAENEIALAGSGVSVDDFFPAPPDGRKACLPPKKLPPKVLLAVIAGLTQAAGSEGTAPSVAKK